MNYLEYAVTFLSIHSWRWSLCIFLLMHWTSENGTLASCRLVSSLLTIPRVVWLVNLNARESETSLKKFMDVIPIRDSAAVVAVVFLHCTYGGWNSFEFLNQNLIVNS